jgi:DNA-binding transcriptional LysR family regulator
VVEAGSFRAAAERLGYAQSAVSHQIATLERALAARLIERGVGRREARPTEAGLAACAHARRLISGFDSMAADFEARARGEAGLVRIGAFQTAAAFLLAEPLGRFTAEHPKVELRLVEGTNDDLRGQLLAGDLDLAFDCDGDPDDDVRLTPLVEDPWVVITLRHGPFGQRRVIEARELHAKPLISWDSPDQRRLESALRGQGIVPDVIFRTNDNVALTRFVAAGIGHACIGSLLGTSLLDPSLVAVPVRGRIRARRIGLATSRRRRLSAAAARLATQIVAASDPHHRVPSAR